VSIIRRALGAARPEIRRVSQDAFFSSGDHSSSGVKVNRESATGIAAVYAAIRLYADTIASLPIGAYVRVEGERRPYFPRPTWLDAPAPQNPNLTGFDFRHRLVTSLLTDGNAFILTIRNTRGDVVEAHVLDPQNVQVGMNADRSPYYLVRAGASNERLDATDIVHVSLFAMGDELRGISPIEHHRRTMGLAIASESFAEKFFSQGATVGGMIEVPGELTPEQAQGLRDAFGSRHEGLNKAHRVAVLSGGAKFSSLPIKVGDLALIDQMGWTVEQVARIYAVPLALLSVATPGAQSYASVEAQITAWLRTGLNPMIVRIEAGFQRMVLGDTTFIKFNTDALLRPTTLERYNAHAVALTNGWLSPNEVRRIEDLPALEDGDGYVRPLNLASGSSSETESQARTYSTLVGAGMDPIEAKKIAGLE
jgi:HK97 family phage portal protein